VLLLILLGILTLTLRDRPPTLPSTAPLYFKIESLEQISTNNNLSVPGYAAASGMQGAWGVLHVSEIALARSYWRTSRLARARRSFTRTTGLGE